MTDEELLRARGRAIAPQLREIRRDLHAHPELSWEEERTSRVVAEILESAGITATRLHPTGVVAEIDGGRPGPVTMLRADLDALPVEDLKEVSYRSQSAGVCHACGHDVHTTCVLGAGMLLQELVEEGRGFPGRVLLVFQPAEEVVPGGATRLLADGWLGEVERAIGLHCDPTIRAGQVGVRVGATTAAVDDVDIVVRSTGGHTARPHLTVDTTFLMGRLLTELGAVVARRVDPRAGLTIGFGSVHAGTAGNVIAREGRLSGTVRTTSLEAWRALPGLVSSVAHTMGLEHDAEVEVDYRQGMPPIENDAALVESTRASTRAILGPDTVVGTEQSMGGDDFGWYGTRMPVVFLRLGTGDGIHTHTLHQGSFDVDEHSVLTGSLVLAGAVALT